MSDHDRPNWHKTWMDIAKTIAERSYSPRLKVGAIIVPSDNTSILSLGYNGNAHGLPNEPESDKPGCDKFLHAELNAIIKLDYHHPAEKVMYVTHSPCYDCAKLIIQARIKRVIYENEYRIKDGIDLLGDAGIEPWHYLSDGSIRRVYREPR